MDGSGPVGGSALLGLVVVLVIVAIALAMLEILRAMSSIIKKKEA